MAKKKHKETEQIYCNSCKLIGTDACKKCVEVYNEENEQYLQPTRYKHAEEVNISYALSRKDCPCTTCKYHYVHTGDDPCRECLEHAVVKEDGAKDFINYVERDNAKVDNVNHPHHYEGSTSIECIQAMTLIFGEDAVADFCACNAFKYMWRYKNKNGMEDLKKAEWYLNKIEDLKGKYADRGPVGFCRRDTYLNLQTLLKELLEKETEK